MSSVQRVLLLLCVAVLLREGSSNSPLDFLRDIKNRIFSTNNSTEAVADSTQCSGLEGRVCALNATVHEIDSGIENSDLLNGTLDTDYDVTSQTQQSGNESVIEDTYETNNTAYYDEQTWNATEFNTTEELGKDFEYPDVEQNDMETLCSADRDNQTDCTRHKRQAKSVEVNITFDNQVVPTQSLVTSLINETENITSSTADTSELTTEGREFTIALSINLSNTENEQTIPSVQGQNDTGNITTLSNNVILTGDKQKNEETIITLGSLQQAATDTNSNITSDIEELDIKNTELQNTKQGVIRNVTTPSTCNVCTATKDENLSNLSSSASQDTIRTQTSELDLSIANDNSTTVNNNGTNNETNMKEMAYNLANTTHEFIKIAKNRVPASILNYLENNTNILINLLMNNSVSFDDNQLKNLITNATELFKTNITDATEIFKTNITDATEFFKTNVTEATELFKTNITDATEIFKTNLTDATEFFKTNVTEATELFKTNITGTTELFKMNITGTTELFKMNITDATELFKTNVTDTIRAKREKRSINFTILSDDEESDLSMSTFPDATEMPFQEIINVTELIEPNEVQFNETADSVCLKRYEQCTSSADCCENYQCISTEGPNSTFYCDSPNSITTPKHKGN